MSFVIEVLDLVAETYGQPRPAGYETASEHDLADNFRNADIIREVLQRVASGFSSKAADVTAATYDATSQLTSAVSGLKLPGHAFTIPADNPVFWLDILDHAGNIVSHVSRIGLLDNDRALSTELIGSDGQSKIGIQARINIRVTQVQQAMAAQQRPWAKAG